MAFATAATTALALTGDDAVDASTTGFRWALDGTRTLDWSISNGFSGESWTDPAGDAQQIQNVLDTISLYANIHFNYVGAFSTPTAAAAGGSELNLAPDGSGQIFTSNNTWAIGIFPSMQMEASAYPGAAGDVFFNVNSAANGGISYQPGSAGWALILHEVGHALGLKHPHDDGGTGRPTLTQLGVENLDIDWFSVMSYNDNQDWNALQWDPATPMPLDVIALQYLYGPNVTANAGDTLFTLHQTNFYGTIWDPSGNDTVSAAASNIGWAITLPKYQISSVVPTLVGYAVPNSELHLSAPRTLNWLMGNIEGAQGSSFGDQIVGNDLGNRIFGGAGNDSIFGGDGTNYLRGDEGDDQLLGGSGFDDINGNMGNDVASGGDGDDWVVGGKDNDDLSGDAGNDIVYGNLGNDTCSGGAGDDWVRGGKDNDTISGGAGNDWMSGDLGDDTISGGAGADIFHTFGEAGLDRVLDFNRAEGDRAQLDPGTTYSIAQVGADVVISMTGGATMVLVGVTMASLTGDWIFVA